jgi:hypothetical protein
MAESIVSPGVFSQENDQSQIVQGPVEAGAAIIGPTVIGPVNIPTVVTSYSDFKSKFGAAFISGGANFEYLTSIAAQNYFEQGGNTLLVTRVASGSYTPARSNVLSGLGLTAATAVLNLTSATVQPYTASFNGVQLILTGSTAQTVFNGISASINTNTTIDSTASFANPNLVLTSKTLGVTANSYYYVSASSVTYYNGAVNATAFTLQTLAVGDIMNNSGSFSSGSNGSLVSGSTANIRWEIAAANTGSGVFTLIIRRGDDNDSNKSILETWNNISLDPNQNNYISYLIGDQTENPALDSTGFYYLQTTGSYSNKSRYVRVASVNLATPNYFDATGVPRNEYTSSIPLLSSANASGSDVIRGSFWGATGARYGGFITTNSTTIAPLNMFDAIKSSAATTPANNIQGLIADGTSNSNYYIAINLLKNRDAYKFNTIYAPGLNSQNASTEVSDIVNLASDRGDCIAVIDLTTYGQSISAVNSLVTSFDNSYAATYWPWIQIRSKETGRLFFAPASTIIPGIYEFNDDSAGEWFAPAGVNRGIAVSVIRPERLLTLNDRNLLYQANVNPIAQFPKFGTVVYGQKTLQKKPTALDRVNVRRLLIALKDYIGQVGQTLVFEQNNQVTRNKFLSKVNPYLESVQQRQGLYSYQVVMDESNNTAEVIDRNFLVGTIYLQPVKSAEFIQLEFNVQPTGTSFSI